MFKEILIDLFRKYKLEFSGSIILSIMISVYLDLDNIGSLLIVNVVTLVLIVGISKFVRYLRSDRPSW